MFSYENLLKAFLSIACLLIIRVVIVILKIYKCRKSTSPLPTNKRYAIKSMFVLGSGGHTHEMLSLVEPLPPSYQPRIYVIANTDTISEQKLYAMEQRKYQREEFCTDSSREYSIVKITRSRELHQSWVSTVHSTICATFSAIWIMFKQRPDLLLCNGPGTCIPLCIAGLLLSITGIKKVNIIYVESFCRVESMSLSGKLLYYFADHFLVQWPDLLENYPKSKYFGLLI